MTKTQMVLALAFLMPPQYSKEQEADSKATAQAAQITQDQLFIAVAVLVRAGVVEIKDGQIAVKDQSALDQLRASGRLSTEAVLDGSICF